jgi:hypothetical protein
MGDPAVPGGAAVYKTGPGYTVEVAGEGEVRVYGNAEMKGNYTFSSSLLFRVGGSADVAWAYDGDVTNSTIELFGGTAASPVTLVTNVAQDFDIGNLTIGAQYQKTGTYTEAHGLLGTDLRVKGSVKIREDSVLDAGPDRKIFVGANWIQGKGQGEDFEGTTSLDFPNEKSGVFVYRNSAVEFLGSEIYISGSTTWYDFICLREKARIYFSTYYYYYLSPPDYPADPLNPTDPDAAKKFHIHTFYNSFKVISPDKLNKITVTRQSYYQPQAHWLPDKTNQSPHDPSDPDRVASWEIRENRGKFWDFNLVSGAQLDINFVKIYYSNSYRRLPIPTSEDYQVYAAPYFTPNPPSTDPLNPGDTEFVGYYFNINWIALDHFFYSYTEDQNGNGRIDTIRAQAAFELISPEQGAFNDFEVSVKNARTGERYEIDVSRGRNGYTRVWGSRPGQTGLPSPGSSTYAQDQNGMYSVYIYLREKDYDDGDQTLSWQVTRNKSLYELTTETTVIGRLNEDMETHDTVPPRIAYALALPGRPQVYVQLSEPVQNAPGQRIVFEIDGPGVTVAGYTELSPKEYLVSLQGSFSLADLAGGEKKIRLYYAVDFSVRAEDVNVGSPESPQFPSPSYPVDWGYSLYETVRFIEAGVNALLPPHRLVASEHAHETEVVPNVPAAPVGDSAAHRVTDVLISQAPISADDTNFFVWPVWAKDNPTANPDALGYTDPGLLYRTRDTDFGLTWDFTGKGRLQSRDITLQALRHRTLTDFEPELYYAADKRVGEAYRARKIHGIEGLWLPLLRESAAPVFNDKDYNDMVPKGYPYSFAGTRTSVSPNLYNFELIQNGRYESVSWLEFYFLLRSPGKTPFYAARLDMQKGGAVPDDWYRRIKPFTVEIHDLTLQRSGVTILNNVINPTRGEKTILHYALKSGGRVTIQVFTLDGNLVQSLVRESKNAGEYRVSWDGKNRGGRDVARGLYFIRVVAPDIDEIRKVMVVK